MNTINRFEAASIARKLTELSVWIEKLRAEGDPFLREAWAGQARLTIGFVQDGIFKGCMAGCAIETPETEPAKSKEPA